MRFDERELKRVESQRDHAIEDLRSLEQQLREANTAFDWCDVERTRYREAAEAYVDAEDTWLRVVDARPYDAEAAARAALVRREALEALRRALEEI